ncbi:hypothetical protein AB395_00002746 [Sinorhizobium fredii CCBAU 45436]|nr:hypothetical protein AB395_00002746 [Sinorhizobium fredii CCBAU 45436]
MRGVDRYGLAGIRRPFFSEGGVEFLVQFSGRVIGHVQDRCICESGAHGAKLQDCDQKGSLHDSGKSIRSHVDLHAEPDKLSRDGWAGKPRWSNRARPPSRMCAVPKQQYIFRRLWTTRHRNWRRALRRFSVTLIRRRECLCPLFTA